MRLSITIPTFNRAADLQATLARIVPQLAEDVECVIVDNASTDDTPGVAAAAIAQSKFVRVVRHSHNIGGNANFLRCFELAQGQWIWILPDDDLPDETGVAKICDVLSQHPDASYINFATSLLRALKVQREETRTSYGMSEFVANVDSFSHLMFLTAAVYRRDIMVPGLPVAARMGHTYGPFLSLLLLALAKDPGLECVQSRVAIAQWGRPPEWNREELTRGVYYLLSNIPNREDRRRFCRLIEREVPPYAGRRGWLSDLIFSAKDLDADALGKAITRYSSIAALTGRYRAAAISGIFLDACTAVGSRWLCRRLVWIRDQARRTSRSERQDREQALARASARHM
jgi:glycosyltransferase involved in cell wall biosynthesis